MWHLPVTATSRWRKQAGLQTRMRKIRRAYQGGDDASFAALLMALSAFEDDVAAEKLVHFAKSWHRKDYDDPRFNQLVVRLIETGNPSALSFVWSLLVAPAYRRKNTPQPHQYRLWLMKKLGNAVDRKPGRSKGIDRHLRSDESLFEDLLRTTREIRLLPTTEGKSGIRTLLALLGDLLSETFWRVFLHYSSADVTAQVKVHLLTYHALAETIHLLRDLDPAENKLRKEILNLLIRQVSPYCPKAPLLVQLEENWPVRDPHWVAPYLIDLHRPGRVLLMEAIDEAAKGLTLDPDSAEDRDLQARITEIRQMLQDGELEIGRKTRDYQPEPYEPRLSERLHPYLYRDEAFLGALTMLAVDAAALIADVTWLSLGATLVALSLFMLSLSHDKDRAVAHILPRYRHIYLPLGTKRFSALEEPESNP